jgi:hypothetical protein
LAILGQKSLDRFKNTFPVQNKNTPPFCLKMIKGKQSIEKLQLNSSKVQTQENRELSKSPNNQKFVKQLTEGRTKILKELNPADLLNQVTERNPYNKLDLYHISF